MGARVRNLDGREIEQKEKNAEHVEMRDENREWENKAERWRWPQGGWSSHVAVEGSRRGRLRRLRGSAQTRAGAVASPGGHGICLRPADQARPTLRLSGQGHQQVASEPDVKPVDSGQRDSRAGRCRGSRTLRIEGPGEAGLGEICLPRPLPPSLAISAWGVGRGI